jgi:hypothetical protein
MAVIADSTGTPTAVKAALVSQFANALIKYAVFSQMTALITAMQTVVNSQLTTLISDGVTTAVNVRLSGDAQGVVSKSGSGLVNNMNIRLTINPSYK